MDRRNFLKGSLAGLAGAGIGISQIATKSKKAQAKPSSIIDDPDTEEFNIESEVNTTGIPNSMFLCEPVLQNYAETSINIAFGVKLEDGHDATAEAEIWKFGDEKNKRTIKCGGYRVTDMNNLAMLINITGLEPSTQYQYKINITDIIYSGGYDMKTGETESSPVYTFKTAGVNSSSHFCIINDIHYKKEILNLLFSFINDKKPDFVLMNGDVANREEKCHQLLLYF